MQVAALQVVMPKSPEYSPASPRPPRIRVVGWKVGHGKELHLPLDWEERESIDSNSGSVRRFRLPPPIRGPPEIHAYTDSDDKEEEEKDNIAALHEQLAALKLRLNNMDEQVVESEIDQMDLDDKMDMLRKAVCLKIKRHAKATRNEELYRAPDLRI
jgi:hypothetical protein